MTTEYLRGTLTTFSVTLKTTVCPECGIPFGIPVNFEEDLRNSHKTFYCPSGHRQWYPGKSNEEILKEQLRQKENELAQKITANIQLDNQLTKIKKDISKGKCPCCDKTYKHLAKHMARKHPNGR